MRALFVFPVYEPAWAFGGTVSSNVTLCRALARAGVHVVVYTTNADRKSRYLDVPLNKPILLGGVEVWYFRCNTFMKSVFHSGTLYQKLKETVKDFDVIHVAAVWQLLQFEVCRISKREHKPVIVSTHGSFSALEFSNNIKKILFWNMFGKKSIKDSSGIRYTTVEERLKSFSNNPFLAKLPSFIVPNGIDIEDMKKRRNIRNILGIPNDKFLLLFVGRINKIKGIHLILEALKRLNSSEYIFLGIGNKEDIHYFEYLKKISSNIQDSVIWLDPVDRNEVWDFYHASNLFVLSSYHENFSMVVVEAMACGLPVLISKNVAIWREVEADDAGFIVNQDVDEIASVLKQVYENPEILKKISYNARKSAEHRYDTNNVASLMLKAYEDILTRRRSPEPQWQ